MSKRSNSRRPLLATVGNAELSTGPSAPPEDSKPIREAISSENGCKFKTASIDRLIEGTLFKGESEDGLRLLIKQYIAELRPQTVSQFGIVEEMANVRWEIGRLLIVKRDVLANLAIEQHGATERTKISKAINIAYGSKSYANLDRAIHRLRRDFSNLQHDLAIAHKMRIDRAVDTLPFVNDPDPLAHLEAPVPNFYNPKPSNEIFTEKSTPTASVASASKPQPSVSRDVHFVSTQLQSKEETSSQGSGPILPLAA